MDKGETTIDVTLEAFGNPKISDDIPAALMIFFRINGGSVAKAIAPLLTKESIKKKKAEVMKV